MGVTTLQSKHCSVDDSRYCPCDSSDYREEWQQPYVMNPSAGLKIRPFRKAHMNRDTDTELFDLTKYLLEIAKVEVNKYQLCFVLRFVLY